MDTLQQAWPEWKIVKELGSGSFGKVYEIERNDLGGNFKAALKVITIPKDRSEVEELMSQGMDEQSTTAYYKGVVEEIVNEFAIMERLKGNTNIVAYEDHKVVPYEGELGWDIFIRMECLTPLTAYMRTHAFTESDVVKLGIDICRALELCKRQNVIHRDIKPENIFVSDYGDFKLGDFGIARTIEKSTMGMSKKGTYTYMAPEVYMGKPYNATVDMYSLGIVLYRLLNDNRAPFLPKAPASITFSDNENAQTRRLSGEALPAPAHASEAVYNIIRKASAFLPEERFASPTEMRVALERVQNASTNGFAEEVPPAAEAEFEEATVSIFSDGKTEAEEVPPAPTGSYHYAEAASKGGTTDNSTPARVEKEEKAEKTEKAKGKKLLPVILAVAGFALALVLILVVVLLAPDRYTPSYNSTRPEIDLSQYGIDDSPGKEETFEMGVTESYITTTGDCKTLGVDLTADMLWGEYYVENAEDLSNPTEAVLEGMDFVEYCDQYGDLSDISILPYVLFVRRPITLGGIDNISVPDPFDENKPLAFGTDLEDIKKELIRQRGEAGLTCYNNYMEMMNTTFVEGRFAMKDLKYVSIRGVCVVEGNVLHIMKPEFDYDTCKLSYNKPLISFNIEFEGRDLKLSAKGLERAYAPYAWSEVSRKSSSGVFLHQACTEDDAHAYKGIYAIDYTAYWNGDYRCDAYFTDGVWLYGGTGDEASRSGLTMEFREDGTFQIAWERRYREYDGNEGDIEVWFDDPVQICGEYLWCGPTQGLILSIDGQIYRYNTRINEYLSKKMPETNIGEISGEEQSALVRNQRDILSELEEAFSAEGLYFYMDEYSGIVTMDTQLLFDTDEASLSKEASRELDDFIRIYGATLIPYIEEGIVASIVVEGHTDTSGSYEYNQELSERRAEAVAEYCKSMMPDLAEYMSTTGCSYLYPIYDDSGNIDMKASRRVVFKFVMKI